MHRAFLTLGLPLTAAAVLLSCRESTADAPKADAPTPANSAWMAITPTSGSPTARHEAEYVRVGDKFYLAGGRGWRPLDIYDPAANAWTKGTPPPERIHHFQGLEHNGELWLAGAFTGGYPAEKPYPHILIYNPTEDKWRQGPAIPRPRGAAGFVSDGSHLYLVSGLTNGHIGGHVTWLDRLDPVTGEWTQLADCPRARDHFRAVLIDGKIYNTAGRRTAHKSPQGVFGNTVPEVDIYDIANNTWTTLPATANIPTPRAGNAATAHNGQVVVAGGESNLQRQAYATVESLDPTTLTWSALPDMIDGRHGSGLISYRGALYTASGCGNAGGNPELTSQEMLPADGLK